MELCDIILALFFFASGAFLLRRAFSDYRPYEDEPLQGCWYEVQCYGGGIGCIILGIMVLVTGSGSEVINNICKCNIC